MDRGLSERDVVDMLRTVYDGCCEDRRISIVDVGLVDRVEVHGDSVHVDLVLTTGWCPFSAGMLANARQRLEAHPEVREAVVRTVWDKPWTPERMDAALAARVRLLPMPVRATDRDPLLRQWREQLSASGGNEK